MPTPAPPSRALLRRRNVVTPRPLRVVLIGSECTGKTELAEWLAAELRVPRSVEYAREYAEAVGGDTALTAADVEPIALGQRAAEDAAIAAATAGGDALVVHDTDLLSTSVYATEYYGAGSVPGWVRALLPERRPSLYLLCDIDVPWQDDVVRDPACDRGTMQEAFASAVRAAGVPVVPVRGDRGMRRATTRGAVERLLEERSPRG